MPEACPKCGYLLLVRFGMPSLLDAKSCRLCLTCSTIWQPYRNRRAYAGWFALAVVTLIAMTSLVWLFLQETVSSLFFLSPGVVFFLFLFTYGYTVFAMRQVASFSWLENSNARLRFRRFKYRATTDRLYTSEFANEFNSLIDGILEAATELGQTPVCYQFDLVVSLYFDHKEVDFRNAETADRVELHRLQTAIEQLPKPPIPSGVAYFEFGFAVGELSIQSNQESRKV